MFCVFKSAVEVFGDSSAEGLLSAQAGCLRQDPFSFLFSPQTCTNKRSGTLIDSPPEVLHSARSQDGLRILRRCELCQDFLYIFFHFCNRRLFGPVIVKRTSEKKGMYQFELGVNLCCSGSISKGLQIVLGCGGRVSCGHSSR